MLEFWDLAQDFVVVGLLLAPFDIANGSPPPLDVHLVLRLFIEFFKGPFEGIVDREGGTGCLEGSKLRSVQSTAFG